MAEDPGVDRLYELDLDAFVPERDALAKRLRADKDREGADAVKALRKPSRAAWATNVVVRGQATAVAALARAADALTAAQEEALGGGDATGMRAALGDVREAIGALVAEVPKGESEATREAVAATLQAAVMDPDAREAVLAGRLDRELEPAGFGGLGSSAPRQPAGKRRPAEPKPEPEPEPDDAKRKPKPKAKAKAKARAARKRAEAAIADTRKALTAARKATTAAEKERDAADKAHDRAQEQADRARTALAAAEDELRDAGDRRDAAHVTLDERATEAEELETALARAEADLDASD